MISFHVRAITPGNREERDTRSEGETHSYDPLGEDGEQRQDK